MVVVFPSDFELFQELTSPEPKYRNSRTGARSTRTQIDHDVFEGLPIRHWRKRPLNVNAAPEKESPNVTSTGNLTWPELPMPRDAHLLSTLSQALLRAARMPQVKKSPTPLMEDEKEAGEDEDAEGFMDMGFVAKRWALVPKDMEGPEPKFLAKRRKGLPSVHTGSIGPLGGTGPMRKTKILKTDVDGKNYVWEVLVPEGQTVDGEVIEEETSPIQAPAPGTVVEGIGVANTEGLVIAGDRVAPIINRRRPPPPKRKAKGPGRGKKKKVAFAPGADGASVTLGLNGAVSGAQAAAGDCEDVTSDQGAPDGDVEMGEVSMLHDGEEGSTEGSEGEEGEDGDREEGELSPSLSPSKSPTRPLLPVILTESLPELQAPQPSLAPLSPKSPHQSPSRATDELMMEPAMEPLSRSVPQVIEDPVDVSMSEPLYETIRDPPKGSIVEATAEPITEPITEPIAESIAAPVIDNVTEPAAESMADLTTETNQEPFEEPPAERIIEAIPAPTIEPNEEALEEDVAKPMSEAASESVIDTALELVTEAETDPLKEPTIEPTTETMAEFTREFSTELTDELVIEPVSEAITEYTMQPVMEASVELTNEPLPEDPTEPKVNPEELIPGPKTVSPGASVQVQTELNTDHIIDPMPGPLTEHPAEATTDLVSESMEDVIEPIVEPLNQTVRDYVPETAPKSRTGSWAGMPAPISSPKAPTPSPPTPIETTFRGPYLSPKAPTMSPPTPVARELSSSPDLPLATQQFQLPPQIDAAQEAELAPVLGMQQIPDTGHIEIEAAPQVEAQVEAQIPVDHDPLDGLAEPKIIGVSASHQPLRFPDGEEDLLGSLERSLSKGGDGSWTG
ncbi:hypothetical protein MMC28_009681 [Mycoblastus sanguinarius]|nr:hypothetical protein [Mycoblastus sanguinarius]